MKLNPELTRSVHLSCTTTPKTGAAIEQLLSTGLWGTTRSDVVDRLLSKAIREVLNSQHAHSRDESHGIVVERDIAREDGGRVDIVTCPAFGNDWHLEVPSGTSHESIIQSVKVYERGFDDGAEYGAQRVRADIRSALGIGPELLMSPGNEWYATGVTST